jgi:hypothetical protein
MMFGLTKREQRWAAEQKAAETIVPLLTAAIEARTAMDTNDRIAALEADLTQAVQMYVDAAQERDEAIAAEIKAEAELAKVKAERDAAVADAGRYRFIASRVRVFSPHIDGQHVYAVSGALERLRGPSFDVAIDAARSGGGNK